jgi:hypothetical protein
MTNRLAVLLPVSGQTQLKKSDGIPGSLATRPSLPERF